MVEDGRGKVAKACLQREKNVAFMQILLFNPKVSKRLKTQTSEFHELLMITQKFLSNPIHNPHSEECK